MDSEKELLLFNIKGKFVKNFDTFSAMVSPLCDSGSFPQGNNREEL